MAEPAKTPIPTAILRKQQKLEQQAADQTGVTNLIDDNVVSIQPGAVTPVVTPVVTIDPVVGDAAPDPSFAETFVGVATPTPVAAPIVEPVFAGAPIATAPAALAMSFDDFFTPSLEPTLTPAVAPVAAQVSTPITSAQDTELLDLRKTIADLQAQVAATASVPVQTPSQAPVQSAGYGLSADEQETYAGSLPIIERVARSIADASVQRIADRLATLESGVTQALSVREDLNSYRGQTYKQQLYAAVPDIDALVGNQVFAQFAAQQIPYSDETIRSRLGRAHQSQDLVAVTAIMKDFRQAIGGNSTEGVMSLASPVSSAASASPQPPVEPEKKLGVIPFSRMKEATRQKTAGHMSAQEYNSIVELFEKADAEGRVDYNS